MNWNICRKWKFFHFSNFFENPIFRPIGEVGNFSSKFRWIGTFAESGNFSTFQIFSKIQVSDRLEKLEIFPVNSDELEHLLKVEIFPIWKHRKMFFQNLIDWNICSCGKISDKSENFPLFQLLRKIFHFANLKKKYGQKHDFLSKNRKIPEKQKNCELFEIFYIK